MRARAAPADACRPALCRSRAWADRNAAASLRRDRLERLGAELAPQALAEQHVLGLAQLRIVPEQALRAQARALEQLESLTRALLEAETLDAPAAYAAAAVPMRSAEADDSALADAPVPAGVGH